MDKLDSIMPVLLDNEKKASEIKKLVVGNWIDAHILQAEDQPYKAKSIKTFSFGKDGKFESSEACGTDNPLYERDWKFISWGTYDFKGDTIILSINRENAPNRSLLSFG